MTKEHRAVASLFSRLAEKEASASASSTAASLASSVSANSDPLWATSGAFRNLVRASIAQGIARASMAGLTDNETINDVETNTVIRLRDLRRDLEWAEQNLTELVRDASNQFIEGRKLAWESLR